MFKNIHPRTYNMFALSLTVASSSIVATIALKLTDSLSLAFILASMVGYGFGRFLMPLR